MPFRYFWATLYKPTAVVTRHIMDSPLRTWTDIVTWYQSASHVRSSNPGITIVFPKLVLHHMAADHLPLFRCWTHPIEQPPTIPSPCRLIHLQRLSLHKKKLSRIVNTIIIMIYNIYLGSSLMFNCA